MKKSIGAGCLFILLMSTSAHGGLWGWWSSAPENQSQKKRFSDTDFFVALTLLHKDLLQENFKRASKQIKIGQQGVKWKVPTFGYLDYAYQDHGEKYSDQNKPFVHDDYADIYLRKIKKFVELEKLNSFQLKQLHDYIKLASCTVKPEDYKNVMDGLRFSVHTYEDAAKLCTKNKLVAYDIESLKKFIAIELKSIYKKKNGPGKLIKLLKQVVNSVQEPAVVDDIVQSVVGMLDSGPSSSKIYFKLMSGYKKRNGINLGVLDQQKRLIRRSKKFTDRLKPGRTFIDSNNKVRTMYALVVKENLK